MKRIGIIVAGGSGQRMGTQLPKQFLDLNDVPILIRTLNKFISSSANQIVLVLPENQFENWFKLKEYLGFDANVSLVAGGKTRFESVGNALKCIDTNEEEGTDGEEKTLVQGVNFWETIKKVESRLSSELDDKLSISVKKYESGINIISASEILEQLTYSIFQKFHKMFAQF